MVFDNDGQKKFILELIKQASISGQLLEMAYSIKKAVEQGEVREEPPK